MAEINQVLKILNNIEANIDEKVTAAELATASGLSAWHSQRMFQQFLGESIGAYLRKRRLTQASYELVESDKSVLDIALTYGFESQEVFTRAFKRMFGVSPSIFRRMGKKTVLQRQPALTTGAFQHLATSVISRPKIVSKPEMKFVGVELQHFCAFSGDAESEQRVAGAWSEFNEIYPSIPHKKELDQVVKYAVISAPSGDYDGDMTYMVATEVSSYEDMPVELIQKTVPAFDYALFIHKGPIDFIKNTISWVYSIGMPRAGYKAIPDGPHLERIDSRFKAYDKSSEIELLMPLQER